MTEDEYIVVSDLARVRLAKDALRTTLPSSYGLEDADVDIQIALRKWEERLEKIVEGAVR